MKSKALQELVKKIFNDEKTKQQFMSNPDSVISRFCLTKEEKEAVLNIHNKLGFVSSDTQQLEATLDPTWEWYAPVP